MTQERRRFTLVSAATTVLLVATAVIVWRVLRPAEVVTPATTSYPSAVLPAPGAVGALVSAPLILDERIRVFAKKREVWSDGPAAYHYERSAYWAYRRWPAEVTGVAVVEAQRSIVVTAWSDGLLVGIEAGSGTVVWRTQGDPLAESYTGRRTGTETVYLPPGLFTSGSHVITVASSHIRAFSPLSGEELWGAPSPVTPECLGAGFTTPRQLFVLDKCGQTLNRIDAASGALLSSLPAADVEPVSCAVGHSNCSAMRVTFADTVSGWLLTHDNPIESKPLGAPGALLADQTAIVPGLESVSAIELSTGQPRWTWSPQGSGRFRLLAADATRTLILEPDGMLVSLNSVTGRLLIRTSVLLEHEPDSPYDVNMSYTSGAYLVLERTIPDASPDAKDEAYFFTNRPMLLAYWGLIG